MIVHVVVSRTIQKSYPQAYSSFPPPIPYLSTLKFIKSRCYPQSYPHYTQVFHNNLYIFKEETTHIAIYKLSLNPIRVFHLFIKHFLVINRFFLVFYSYRQVC